MIVINVVAYNGHPPVESLTAEFDELGGSIGRGEGNTLILPDPERRISRIHASITFQGGRYVLQDRGSATPVQVNGRVIGQGNEFPISEGDELTIGGFTLRVTKKSIIDSQATQFGMRSPVTNTPVKDDPLALFGADTPPKQAVGDLIATATTKPAPSAIPNLIDDPFASSASKSAQSSIPSDFDPFGDLRQNSPASNESGKLPDDFSLGISSSTAGQGIDELFGLNANTSSDPFAPGSPLADSVGTSSASSSVDPLIALGGATDKKLNKHPQATPQRNDVSELHGHFQPPRMTADPAVAKAVPAASETSRSSPVESDMVLSWEDQGDASGEIKTMIIPSRRKEVEAAGADAPPALNPAPPRPEVVADPLALFNTTSSQADPLGLKSPQSSATTSPKSVRSATDMPSETPAAKASGSTTNDELLRAFLEGAGVSALNIPGGLNVENMHMIGALLRTAMQGTLDLLLARAVIKREVRAEMTMIVARENNPLKFSPNVEAALTHLLAPQAHGFMPPLKAMQDAYNDLRSHQIGFMAGMRAALAGVLLRFNPEQLEERLATKRVMDSLLPMNRKSRLWEMFENLYGDISDEAEEDFHALFGKEFVRAYEAQIDKLEQEEKNKMNSPRV